MRRILFTVCVTMALLWSGCLNAEYGSGTIVSEARYVGNFSRLAVDGAAEIVLRVSDERGVTIFTDDNLIDEILVREYSGKLVVSTYDGKTIRPTTLRIIIEMPALEISEIEVDGSATITAEDPIITETMDIEVDGSATIDIAVVTDLLAIAIDGSADVTARGDAYKVAIAIDGSASVDTYNLTSKKAAVEINGSGFCRIQADDFISIEINGSGSVWYRGTENVRSHISGSGDIRRD